MSADLPDTTLTLNTLANVPIAAFPFAYIDWVVLVNASPFACHASFGGYNFLLPAWYYYPVQVHDSKGNLTPGISTPFTVTPYLQTIPGVGFTSVMHSTIFMQGETPPSTVASPLGGGPVDLTQASEVINTGHAAFTTFIFAEPVGDASALGAVNLTNAGFLQLGDASYQGDITISGPSGKSSTLTNDAATLQTLSVVGTAANSTSLDNGAITTNGAGKLTTTGAGFVVLDPAGIMTVSSKVGLPTGSLARISKFSGTANTTPTFFNHGLGAVPDVVMIVGDGTSSTLHTFFVDYASLTSTQAKITNDSAGGTPFVALAIKF